MARTLTAAAIAVLGLAALLLPATSASAQANETVKAQAKLPDGRAVTLFTLSDGAGYRLDIAGAAWSGGGDGTPEGLVVGDVDQDGAADAVVLLASREPGMKRAEVWDVTIQGPMLMYISDALQAGEQPIPALQREASEQLSLSNALGVLQYASDSVNRGGDIDPATLRSQVSTWLSTARAALLEAEVARARAAVKAAKPKDVAAPLSDLRLALQARAKFAAEAAVEFLKAQRAAAAAAAGTVATPGEAAPPNATLGTAGPLEAEAAPRGPVPTPTPAPAAAEETATAPAKPGAAAGDDPPATPLGEGAGPTAP
jgi:hypothetical protein